MLKELCNFAVSNATTPAVVEVGGEAIDYASLVGRVAGVAALIREKCGSNGYIIVKPQPTIRSVVSLLAVMASGNTVVPVSATTGPEQLAYISRMCDNAEELDDSIATSVTPRSDAPDLVSKAEVAMVLFTSGTTGVPKGVLVSAGNLAHSCREIASYLDYKAHRSAAIVLPLYYSYSLISQLLAQLSIGGTAYLFATTRNPIKVAAAVTNANIAVFSGVPATFAALAMFHALHPLEMPSVAVVCSAGAPFDLQRYAAIKAIFPNGRIFNNYGATEATPRISYVADDEPQFFDGACGRPIAGLEVATYHQGRRLDLGEVGILAVKGPNVTAGYLNDPERTAAAFTPDGYFLTNDIGTIRDGFIYVQGRADDIFDVGGEKVSPGEVEQALMSFAEVERAAVVGRPDAARGHVPLAFVKTTGNITKAELNQRLGAMLAPIKIPVRYYRVEAFPETSNGKLKRQELKSNEAEYTRNEIS